MVNAPTRRPQSYPDRRRPSRGSRHVARAFRERLTIAANLLEQDGHEDAAADVRAVLAPGGWTLLRSQPGEGSGSGSNLAVQMPMSLKAALVAAGDALGVSLTAVAQDGVRAVVEGTWVPPKTLRATSLRPKSGARTNLNVRVSEELLKEVRPLLPVLTKKLDYRVSLASIVTAWLAEELGVDYPSGDDVQTLKLVTARILVDHVHARAGELGVSLTEVVEAGIRDLLSGERVPQTAEWAVVSSRPRESGKWQVGAGQKAQGSVRPTKLSIPVGDGLLDDLREWCADRTEAAEWPVYPGSVGIAILKDRLGEPAE